MTGFPDHNLPIGNASFIVTRCTGSLLPPGPYLIYANAVFEACRLYDDEFDCFAVTLAPPPSHSAESYDYSPHCTLSMNGRFKTVAVPSRLSAGQSDNKPLAGLRIAVKDNLKLASIGSTNGNWAFAESHLAEQETARYARLLVKAGARIVVKTKMTSFASGEEPTDQWIDYHCPFNPRGDAYQKPGSSSSGAAACLAAYPWIDISIGTDSNQGSTPCHQY